MEHRHFAQGCVCLFFVSTRRPQSRLTPAVSRRLRRGFVRAAHPCRGVAFGGLRKGECPHEGFCGIEKTPSIEWRFYLHPGFLQNSRYFMVYGRGNASRGGALTAGSFRGMPSDLRHRDVASGLRIARGSCPIRFTRRLRAADVRNNEAFAGHSQRCRRVRNFAQKKPRRPVIAGNLHRYISLRYACGRCRSCVAASRSVRACGNLFHTCITRKRSPFLTRAFSVPSNVSDAVCAMFS